MESIQCILDGIALCTGGLMTPGENTSAPIKYQWVGNILDISAATIMGSLTPIYTHTIKLAYRKMKRRIVSAFASYAPEAFKKALGRLGVSRGDAVMMHVSFDSFTGFRGGPKDVIDCVLNGVGPEATSIYDVPGL